jgi:CheY-like chemotaxis protein
MGAPISMALDAKKHRAWGDRARIQQVFWNLLANAIKFTPAEGRISIRTWNEAERLHIEIADTGVGMEANEITRIFGAFEQGSRNVARAFGGVGLGLAITRSLVELHQGTISAASPGRGHGTTFTLVFPLLDETKAAREKKSPALLQRSLQVLVVEDHHPTLTALTRLLEKEGHVVTSASRIQDAISASSRQCFDVLISDLGLPDGSGVELVRYLRSSSHLGPAIALSGLGMDEDIQASRAAGFDRHLVKPVDWQQLRATISETLQRYIARQQSQSESMPASTEGTPEKNEAAPPTPGGLSRSA